MSPAIHRQAIHRQERHCHIYTYGFTYFDIGRAAAASVLVILALGVVGLVAAGVMILQLAVAVLASYAIVRFRTRAGGLLLLGGTAAILVPAQALLVPQFLMTSRAGWLNSYAGLIVPQLAGVGLALFLNTEGANPGPLLAAATLSALPVLIGYLFTARRA